MSNKTYAGIDEEYSKLETAKIVLIPVPYDGTSTWQKGADKGPDAFLNASENMELYDIETETEVYKQGVYLADAVTENSSPEKMVDEVHQTVKKYIKRNKFVTAFRVLNHLRMWVCEEHSHSHSIVAGGLLEIS